MMMPPQPQAIPQLPLGVMPGMPIPQGIPIPAGMPIPPGLPFPPQILIQKCWERPKYERFLKVLYIILRCGISGLRTTEPMEVSTIN